MFKTKFPVIPEVLKAVGKKTGEKKETRGKAITAASPSR